MVVAIFRIDLRVSLTEKVEKYRTKFAQNSRCGFCRANTATAAAAIFGDAQDFAYWLCLVVFGPR